MFEYIFFHRVLAEEFAEQLRKLAIPFEEKADEMGFVVAISDVLDDKLIDQASSLYEVVFAKTEDLLAKEDVAPEKNIAAISLHLSDGRTAQALVKPELLNRILSAISPQELNEFVEAITDAIDSPDERPICQR